MSIKHAVDPSDAGSYNKETDKADLVKKRQEILDKVREDLNSLTIYLVDYGSIDLGTPQSRLLIEIRKLLFDLEHLE